MGYFTRVPVPPEWYLLWLNRHARRSWFRLRVRNLHLRGVYLIDLYNKGIVISEGRWLISGSKHRRRPGKEKRRDEKDLLGLHSIIPAWM